MQSNQPTLTFVINRAVGLGRDGPDEGPKLILLPALELLIPAVLLLLVVVGPMLLGGLANKAASLLC